MERRTFRKMSWSGYWARGQKLQKPRALQMLEHATTQQAIRGHASARRSRGPGGRAVADQLDQLRVIQELIDGFE